MPKLPVVSGLEVAKALSKFDMKLIIKLEVILYSDKKNIQTGE
jgi:hypothetical protein